MARQVLDTIQELQLKLAAWHSGSSVSGGVQQLVVLPAVGRNGPLRSEVCQALSLLAKNFGR